MFLENKEISNPIWNNRVSSHAHSNHYDFPKKITNHKVNYRVILLYLFAIR